MSSLCIGTSRITPAGAGKTQVGVCQRPNPPDHPRRCGENWQARLKETAQAGSPPQVRGKPDMYGINQPLCRITPAGAGKTTSAPVVVCAYADHPRACGENPDRIFLACDPSGSPPRMRGKQGRPRINTYTHGITPAHAGKTVFRKLNKRTDQDHPRACGENFLGTFA